MNNKPQMMGVRGWSLLVPALLSAVGFFCFGVLGFSFTELTVLPEAFRTTLVLTGAFALAFGAEVGTLSNVVEIYRKGQQVRGWDAIALAISILATFTAFILAFATLLGVSATWGATVRLYGPIALGLLAALDSYGNFLEFGLYLNSYDARLESYERKQEQAQERKLQDAERLRQAVAQGVAAELERLESEAQAAREERKRQREARKKEQVQEQKKQVSLPDYASLDTAEAIKVFYANNPLATQAQAAQAAEVSRARVGQVLAQLEQAGKIKRNGQGVEIL